MPRRRGPEASQRFVILSTQRSGSNWVEQRLASHPAVRMHVSEPFRRTLVEDGYRAWIEGEPAMRWVARLAPGVAKHRYLSSMGGDHRVHGFRLMYDQLRRDPSVGASVVVRRMPIIHLVRRNVLATLVSVVAARRTGVFVTESSAKPSPRVELEARGLLDELDRREAAIVRHRRLLRPLLSLEISYEDYRNKPDEGDRAVLDFLGLHAHPELTSRLQQQGRGTTADRIANLDDVRAVLEGSRFAWCLDE